MSILEATSTGPDARSDPSRLVGLESALVCVLGGGRSSEREISLRSAERIALALSTPSGEDDRRGPRGVLAVEIREDGRWKVGGDAVTPGSALDALADVDVFVSGLHGGEGEDGSIQGLLTSSDRAFTGSGVLGSAVGMDKVLSRVILAGAGLRVAKGRCVRLDEFAGDAERVLDELVAWPVPGWVVKPRSGGSSVGTTVCRDRTGLASGLASAFEWEGEALVEELVLGVEATGGVLATPDNGLEALPVVEIRPHEGGFFDYHEKYADDGALELCPPRAIDARTCELIRRHALLAHRALRCDGYSRTDFIVPSDGSMPVCLELNTLPGMTPRSLVPLAAGVAGIDYRTLCLWIAADALARARS